MRIHNLRRLKERRQKLRNKATKAEAELWRVIQHSKLGGKKFRRQHSVGYYILDFYCPEERLAIEIDGDSHEKNESTPYDKSRTEFLESMRIRVLRFKNEEVLNNLESVTEQIRKSFEPPLNPLLE
ncbi:MAG: endonuclease domain-containing protein [Candidatus Zixiibacteriota bacterium]